jgi:uncharacterized delta-60 repeat protein
MKTARQARKNTMGIFLILAISLLVVDITSADEWAVSLGGSYEDRAQSIQQTVDGGYIVAGYTASFGAGLDDMWVIKLNADGSVDWQNTYGGSGSDKANSVQQTSDGGYVVAGFTESFGTGLRKFWVLRLDTYGTIIWQKTYRACDFNEASSIQQTADGGYLVVGRVDNNCEGFDAGDNGFFLLKLSSEGTVIWQKAYEGGDWRPSIQQTEDGGYIMAGGRNSVPNGLWVLKLNSEGNIIWDKISSISTTGSIKQTADGGFIVTGHSVGANQWDFAVSKLNPDGTIEWQKTYGGSKYDFAQSVSQTSDGGYILTGWTDSFGSGLYDVWVIKLNPDGGVAWERTFGTPGDNWADIIQQTADGGYILAGKTSSSFGYSQSDVWVLKLDENGQIPHCRFMGTSQAIVADTEYTMENINVFPVVPSVVVTDTTALPQNTPTNILMMCSDTFSWISVISPNGGDVIPSGSKYNLQWQGSPDAVKFTLKYSINNGTTWKLIAKNITGASYSWTVPSPANNKMTCLVKVIGFNSSGTKVGEDISDSTFTIEVVKLTSPDGGETLTSGSPHTITWTTHGTIRPVANTKLFRSINSGSTWTLIKTLTGNPGSYNWTVPTVSSSNCKVKVVLKDTGNVTVGSDVSDGVFTIQP